ncbi:MAG: GWxTD domain-containing protein [Flavobacteriales bacterium]|jgi:GWxTD domain-containing protein
MRKMKMRRNLLFIVLILCTIGSNAALRASFDYKQFLIPGEGPFVEILFSFEGQSLHWAAADSAQAEVAVETTIIFSQGDQIIDFRKVTIKSTPGLNGIIADFIDIQRFQLAPGEYQLDVTLEDINAKLDGKVELSQNIKVNLKDGEVGISDITYVEAYAKAESPTELTKSGMDILPFVADYFPPEANKLVFYAEVYNAQTIFPEGQYLLTYALYNEYGPLENTRRNIRQDSQSVTPLLKSVDLTDVPSGKYDLLIELRSKENETMYVQSATFFRQNEQEAHFASKEITYVDEPGLAFNNIDSMRYYLDSCYPIGGTLERRTIDGQVASGELEVLQNVFETFWLDRDATSPTQEWLDYYKEVCFVNRKYTTQVMHGHRSDRGRVYLQYGKPNTIVVKHNETEVFPYEIWHYYKIQRFNNKRFLFYSRNVVNADFEMLHSDMLGEIQNEDWLSIMRTKNNDLRPSESALNRQDARDTNSRDELEDLFYNPR